MPNTWPIGILVTLSLAACAAPPTTVSAGGGLAVTNGHAPLQAPTAADLEAQVAHGQVPEGVAVGETTTVTLGEAHTPITSRTVTLPTSVGSTPTSTGPSPPAPAVETVPADEPQFGPKPEYKPAPNEVVLYIPSDAGDYARRMQDLISKEGKSLEAALTTALQEAGSTASGKFLQGISTLNPDLGTLVKTLGEMPKGSQPPQVVFIEVPRK
jgi:hypothetical protein